ncbi:hypothetical protein BGZ98_006232 [Dissophora globulifera]|nr:hypothetical protein BGZ98_006232 [Dissophora globulifera]
MVTPSPEKLHFRQKLTGNASELLKKLKELHTELKAMDQEIVDTSSLSSVTKQLIDSSVINHKDKGVRIYVACCIADLLRLYAPDAPYTNSNLKVRTLNVLDVTVFGLFIDELRHIVNPAALYFNMYYYLLESLSAVKSIILITDLKNADGLMIDLVRNIFDDIRPQQAKNVQVCMTDLVRYVVEEANQLPQEIVDIILAQFLHKQKFDNPAAYRLACELGNNCTAKLQRYVFQYFSDIVSAAGAGELSNKALADFKTVHQLVIELNKSAPGLLLNVIPQLEEELKFSDVTLRTLATKALGEMFAEKTIPLATQYDSTWRAWLQRRNDKAPQVRVVWIESLTNLIKSHKNLAKELSDGLGEKIVDPDEKKVVSKEAINALSVLYSQAHADIESGKQASIFQFGWMPSAMLHAVYINDNEVFSFVDNAVFTTLFPPNGSVVSRTQRLVTIFSSLDDRGRTGFLSVLRRGADARVYMTAYLQLLKSQETSSSRALDPEEYEKKLGTIIKATCDRLPDPSKSSIALHKYAQVNDAKLQQLMFDCMDSSLSLKEIKRASKKALSHIESIAPQILEVFSVLIQRISLTLVNSEVLSELIKNVGESEEHREASGDLLRSISLIFPAIFEKHLTEVTSLLRDPGFAGASDSLHTLADFAKQFPRSMPVGAKAKETLRFFLDSGTVVQAKHATIVLASVSDNVEMCRDIAASIQNRLDVTSTRLLLDLTVLSQLVLYSPQAFESVASSVIAFIIKKLLMSNTAEQEIMGLKILVNRAIVLLESDSASAHDAVRPVFNLLWTIIKQGGELVDDKNTKPVYEKMVSVSDYGGLALVIQDPVFGVRQGLAARVMKYLRSKELHIRYLAVLVLAAHEPELGWRLDIRSFLVQQSKIQANDSKLMLNELTLARVMHLLANHPDFVPKSLAGKAAPGDQVPVHSVEDLNLAVKYIEFYLDTMANSENISLIYYIVSLLKTVRFANPGEPTRNLYVASDLGQYLIQERSRSHNWTLTSYPGQVKLPGELFAPLGQDELSAEVGFGESLEFVGVDSMNEAKVINSNSGDLGVQIATQSFLPLEWVRARESRAERKVKTGTGMEKKMGQAAKRRSRSPSSALEDDEGVADSDEEIASRAKRPKKSKVVGRVPEEPKRRMASRAAKAKAAAYRDAETSEEATDDDESGEDSM